MTASTSLIWDKNLLPKPSPLEAPSTSPAISTNSIVVLIFFFDFDISTNLSSLSSGTGTIPTFVSIVQKGKFAGSSAGHNGIESIDKFIGKDYSRVRIGIGKPKSPIEVGDYVLQNFDEDEMIQLEKITKNIIDSMAILIDKKLDLFSSTVNNK